MSTPPSRRLLLAQLCVACFAHGAFAQSAPPATAPTAAEPPLLLAETTIQQITIKGQALADSAKPYSSTVIQPQQIRDQAITQPEELLRLVPGVVVRSLSLGGVVNSVTIRGFSSGAHGGDLGMVADGIPLNEAMSHADGYADLNVIVPLEVDRFEVFRGPVSALYGNFNRGGVIALQTRRGGKYALVDASVGSFGTVDAQAAIGADLGPGRFNGAVQGNTTDGYRPGFKYTRGTVAGRWSLDLSKQSDISLSARAHTSDWDSAGNVTKARFQGPDPYGREPQVVNDGGLKRYSSGRVDFNHLLSEKLKFLSFAYANQQDYTRYFTRPLNSTTWSQREETYDRDVRGLGFSFNGRNTLAGGPFAWTAGAELYRESTYFLNYEGTRARQRVNAAVYDRTYRFNSVSAFAEAEATLSPLLRPTLGVRWDRFTGDCQRNGPETGTADPCSRLNDESRATPKLGLRSTVLPGLDLRSSYSEGFALPPGAAKYGSGGATLEPTVFKQTELGASYNIKSLLRADLALYRIASSNEVRTVSPGVFENFGQTQRNGIEASLRVTPLTHLELGLVWTTTEAKVKQNSNAALVGKFVTGVPREAGTLSVGYRPAEGFGASAEARYVGPFAVTANNSDFYPAYTTLDLGLFHNGRFANTGYRAYLKVENATDRLYATSTGIVSGGLQTYNVAPPRGVRVGVQFDL